MTDTSFIHLFVTYQPNMNFSRSRSNLRTKFDNGARKIEFHVLNS